MAVELFKPFIIHKLVEKGIAETVKRAKKIVERESPEVYEILEEIIQDHPVLLNRAPTLHRLGIQAFEPVLVEGKAIRIHPLVCAAFNADFDGDQMAVHVPLSFEAQLEARLLMISSNNVLKPSDGRPVAEPSQDMVLGSYFLTKLPAGLRGGAAEGRQRARPRRPGPGCGRTAKHFGSLAELEMALLNGSVGYHTRHLLLVHPAAGVGGRRRPRWLRTTVGRVLFNSILPRRVVAELGFRDDLMKKKILSELVLQSYRRAGLADTVTFLDRLKDFGFRFATMGGVSIGIEDLEIPAEKAELLTEADARVKRFQRAYNTGQITFGERYNKVIDAWTHANNDVAEAMINSMRVSRGGFNPVFMMFDSGSRGSRGPDPAAGRHARPDGQAAEEAHRRHRRDHREPDQVELPRGAHGARVLHLDPRRPEGSGRHGAQDGRRRLPDPPAGGRGAGRDGHRGGLRHDSRTRDRGAQGGRGHHRAAAASASSAAWPARTSSIRTSWTRTAIPSCWSRRAS